MEEIDNTKEVAIQIFNKPPQPKNSIQLQLEEQTSDIATKEGADAFIFEILSVITLHGVEILFGHRDIVRLTEDNLNLLQQYVHSYGYHIKTDIRQDLIGRKHLIIGFDKIY